MNKDEALKLALEAFQRLDLWLKVRYQVGLVGFELDAIKALEEALKQEPDYSICPSCGGMADDPIVPPEHRHNKQEQGEPLEYWNAVEGWVKLDEVREHFDSVSCGTIYKNGGEGRVPLSLAKPKQKQGEPVAYFNPQVKGGFYWAKPTKIAAPITVSVEPMPLYATPQQRKPLTDEQIFLCLPQDGDLRSFARAIEAAHGIKE